MRVLDGARGEGGGQVLRTSLALSLLAGEPFAIDRIRANRRRPGLGRQHLAAVQAAAEVGGAAVEGAALGATRLVFRPGAVAPGDYRFAVGTAGSAGLVLQTVLPALLTASGPTRLRLEGGTHNPAAPPFDFLALAFLPALERMGPRLSARLLRHGFYPRGGGAFEVEVQPCPGLAPLELGPAGPLRARRVRALVARLPRAVGERELEVARRAPCLAGATFEVEEVASAGPGNALLVELGDLVTREVVTAFGERGVPAERVAATAVAAAERLLAASVPVGEHLADQLLLPCALAGGGRFTTLAPSPHFRTNAAVVADFLPARVATVELGPDRFEVRVDR